MPEALAELAENRMAVAFIALGLLLFVLTTILLAILFVRSNRKNKARPPLLPRTTQASIRRELIKKVRSIEIRTRHMVNDVFAGQYHSAFKGQGMEFQEVREYIPGDDIRDIDWNVTARMDQPFIKKYQEERELTVFLVVDVSASMFFGSHGKSKKEIAAEIAALLAFSAIKNNDKVGLILHTDDVEKYVPPGKGSRHVLRVISEVLDFVPAGHQTNLAPVIDFLNHVSHRRSVVLMISDYIAGDDFMRPLTVTGRRHDVVSIIFGDNHEQSLPRVGLLDWHDLETGERFLIDTSNSQTRRRFTSLQTQRRDALLKKLKRMSIDTIEINVANKEYDKEFVKFFRMRAARSR